MHYEKIELYRRKKKTKGKQLIGCDQSALVYSKIKAKAGRTKQNKKSNKN